MASLMSGISTLLEEVLGVSDPTLLSILSTSIFLVLVALVVSVVKGLLAKGGFVKGKNVVFVGGLGSGKTSLYFKLKDGEFHKTHTSMKENSSSFVAKGTEKEHTYVDFPGHGSQRARLAGYLGGARGIVFTISPKGNLQSDTELFYSLLINRDLVSMSVPILVVFTKSDVKEVDMDEMKSNILAKIETMRNVEHTLGDLDESADKQKPLTVGTKGKPFTFDQHSTNITFGTISTKDGEIECVTDFLREL